MATKTLLVTLSCVLFALHVNQAEAGSTYVRWGRTTCPAGASVVHKGYITGAYYNQEGSGGNFLCAHEHPVWGKNNVPGMQSYTGLLYGTEYEIWSQYGYPNNNPFQSDNARGADLNNRDVFCVLCYVPNSSTNFMLTGRPDCGEDNDQFKVEYKGYLMSERSDHKRSEYICVDEAPEGRLGSEANLDGALLYPVQAACGSLPCPDYVDGNEVTCAVCSI